MRDLYRTSFLLGTRKKKPKVKDIVEDINEWLTGNRYLSEGITIQEDSSKIKGKKGELLENKIVQNGLISLLHFSITHPDYKNSNLAWRTQISAREEDKTEIEIKLAY